MAERHQVITAGGVPSVKFLAGLLMVLTLAAFLACGNGPETDTSTGHSAGLLSGLPASNEQVYFAKVDPALLRPGLGEVIEDAFENLTTRTRGVLSKELLASADIKSAVVGVTTEGLGVAILLGDFQGLQDVLQQAPSLATNYRDFEPPRALGPHRGVEVFVIPWYDDSFVAVPDSETLLLAESETLLQEMIDRRLDGAELSEPLARLLSHIESIDILVSQHGGSAGKPAFRAHAASLNEGDVSPIYAYMEFDDLPQADQARERLAGAADLSGVFWGYNDDTVKPVGTVRQEGRAVIVEAVAPDKDVPDLFFSN